MEDKIRLIRCPRCNDINKYNLTAEDILGECPVCCGAGSVPLPNNGFLCVNCMGKGLITIKNGNENAEKMCKLCGGIGIIVI